MSWSAAPSGLVTTAIRRAKAGRGRFRSGSRSPSALSAARTRSSSMAFAPSSAVGMMSEAVSRYSPFSSQRVGRPRTSTSIPSVGGCPWRLSTPAACCFQSMQRIDASASRRVKYQCPLRQILNSTSSPRTNTDPPNAPSTALFACRLSSATVSSSGRSPSPKSEGRVTPLPSPGPRQFGRLERVLEQHRDGHRSDAAGHRRDRRGEGGHRFVVHVAAEPVAPSRASRRPPG